LPDVEDIDLTVMYIDPEGLEFDEDWELFFEGMNETLDGDLHIEYVCIKEKDEEFRTIHVKVDGTPKSFDVLDMGDYGDIPAVWDFINAQLESNGVPRRIRSVDDGAEGQEMAYTYSE